MAGRCRWLFAIVGLAAASPALADTPALPLSYKKVAPGGKYVFVMIAPRTAEDEIRRVYSRSGLYRNDGSAEPLWTVDWYAHGVEVASDGVHLVRHGPWASSTDEEAVSFFANGKLLRTYPIRELVDLPVLLPRSVSHFTWVEEARLNDARLEYTLATIDGNRFVFDLRTGEIVSESRPTRAVLWGAAVLGVAVVGLHVWFRWRRRARLTGNESRTG